MSKTVFILVLIAMLAGCGDAGKQEQRARDTQRREAVAQAQSREIAALDQTQAERARREFWQGLACFAGAWSVVLLIVGVAMGSATIRKHEGGPDASNP
jgi:hypothetical protein